MAAIAATSNEAEATKSLLIDPVVEEELATEAVSWASMNGLQMVHPHHDEAATFIHAPFSLLPNVYPRQEFERAKRLSPLYNLLVDRVACDSEWLDRTLAPVLEDDPFTARLVELWKSTPHQTRRLGIHRSDYMLHGPLSRFLQIELNTIASSFGCISSRVADLHNHMLTRYGATPALLPHLQEALRRLSVTTDAENWGEAVAALHLPENPTLEALPKALAAAHAEYGKDDAVVAFVVQPGEKNVVDQRFLEGELWRKHGVRVRRVSLAQIEASAKIDASSGALALESGEEVSVVYFRAGYTPDDYPSDKEWEGRRRLELSSAIKCPCLAYHLAGTKKVQQQLAQPGEVERFLTADEASAVRESFAALHPMSTAEMGAEAWAALEDAKEHPERFVLKPQREGGGNNFYGDALRDKLIEAFPAAGEANVTAGHKGLPELILMQRIMPDLQPAVLVVRGKSTQGQTLSEFGVFGTFLAVEDEGASEPRIEVNEYGGHILRTKLDGVDEGGVATGYAVLSSPMVV
uniref:Glutathione synthetase n=1 Tax=Rhizochromulina marina TaxID=1034831 RepID=A0A7S2RJR4_9STRA